MENKMIALGLVLMTHLMHVSLTPTETYTIGSKVLEMCYKISQKKNHKSFHMCSATYI